jgi:hypothetical protein
VTTLRLAVILSGLVVAAQPVAAAAELSSFPGWSDPFLITLGARMIAAAVVVIVAAFLVERAGPFIGAMIVTLPITTGPAYVFLGLDHPPAFLATTALSSLVANASTPVFMGIYARLAQTRGVVVSLLVALSAWAASVAAASTVEWTLAGAVLLNIALYSAGALLLRGIGHAASAKPAGRRWWDLPLRAVTVMALCAAVILVARLIGPEAAGFVALAPMGFVSMALVVHPRAGGPTSAAVFANALPGMLGFVAALLVVHLAIVQLGTWPGLLAGLGISMLWNGSLVLVGRRLTRTSPERSCRP